MRRADLLVFLACCGAIVGAAACSLHRQSAEVFGERYYVLDDDQMMSMRYARNLAQGDGLVWNPGERVEGYTSLAWVLVMAGAHLTGAGDALSPALVTIVNAALACWVLWLAGRLLRRLGADSPWSVRALHVSLVLCFDLLYWCAHGFETTLLTAVLLLVVDRILREGAEDRPRWSTYLLLGALPLVRSDAHVLVAAVALLSLGTSRRRLASLGHLSLCAVLPAAHLLFRHAYYGALLPNTYFAKVWGIDWLWGAGLGYTAGFLLWYSPALLLALVGAWRSRARARWLLLAALVPVGVYVTSVGGDQFSGHRFYAPVVPLVLVLSFLGAETLAGQPGRRKAVAVALRAVVAATAAAFLLHRAVALRTVAGALDNNNGSPLIAIAQGALVRGHTDPDARIAVTAAGIVPYLSRRYAVDLLGKADAHVARTRARPGARRIGHCKVDPEHSLGRMRPDLVWFAAPGLFDERDPCRLAPEGWPAYGVALVTSDRFRREFCAHRIEPFNVFYRAASAARVNPRKWRVPPEWDALVREQARRIAAAAAGRRM